MAPTLESLGIDKLSREDQLAIAESIWKNFAGQSKLTSLSSNHMIDLILRLEEDDHTDDSELIPWEEVERELDRRFP